ncbi:MAG TPA: DoxX family protein [Turneriella sp.]|nr:DoxX family protein [Turneriella sp.]
MPFTLVGRILFALPLLVFAFGHFANAKMLLGIVPAWLPGGIIWVYLVGVALAAGAIALLINKLTFQAAMGLALLLLTFALTVHLPALMKGNHASMMGLLKDIALAGAALYIAGHSRK